MANKTDIKENAKFSIDGRIGKAYAVTQKDINNGMVNILFEGEGNVLKLPPVGKFRIEALTLVK